MSHTYVRGSSPMITRQVVRNILDAMDDADIDVIHRDSLQAIIDECDRTLAKWSDG